MPTLSLYLILTVIPPRHQQNVGMLKWKYTNDAQQDAELNIVLTNGKPDLGFFNHKFNPSRYNTYQPLSFYKDNYVK